MNQAPQEKVKNYAFLLIPDPNFLYKTNKIKELRFSHKLHVAIRKETFCQVMVTHKPYPFSEPGILSSGQPDNRSPILVFCKNPGDILIE